MPGLRTNRASGLLTLFICLTTGSSSMGQETAARWDSRRQREAAKLAEKWWSARPKCYFEEWDSTVRAALQTEVDAFGALPEGVLPEVVELLWKSVADHGPRTKAQKGKATLATPYGEAWFYVTGEAKEPGLILGLHGGGEGAGSADEARANRQHESCIGMYPQGIRLVHDTWNTVHGERFALTLIEIAKVQYQVDPDRVYCMGFSMGGSGSWFLAGRHPDLFAGASPCAGVLMADPKSQLPHKEDVRAVQHGLVPNVRNLAMWYYIGLADENCMPGTYMYVADMLEQLRAEYPGGYAKIHFEAYEGLPHAFPPGEPQAGIGSLMKERRDTFPSTLVWEYVDDPFPVPDPDEPTSRLAKRFFYWIHCAEPQDRQRILATLHDNTIDLDLRGTKDGAKGLTIFLTDRMIDPSRDVVVRSGGEEVYHGRPKPDFATVLETLDARLDRSMVFDRRIRL